MKATLVNLMQKLLADNFSLYLKAHKYHWNVRGKDFIQYHNYLESLYRELFEATDDIAEHIRILNAYCPGSLSEFLSLSEIEDSEILEDTLIFSNLRYDNDIVLKTLYVALKFANKEDHQGIASFLSNRIDVHEKHRWMLRSLCE